MSPAISDSTESGSVSTEPVSADRLEELEEEQRVPARASGDLLDVVRRQRVVLRCELDDLDRRRSRQGQQA